MKTIAAIILFCVAGCQNPPTRFMVSYEKNNVNYAAGYDTEKNAVAIAVEDNRRR